MYFHDRRNGEIKNYVYFKEGGKERLVRDDHNI